MDKNEKVMGMRVWEWLGMGMFFFGIAVGVAWLTYVPDGGIGNRIGGTISLGLFCIIFPAMCKGAEDAMDEIRRRFE